MTKTKCSNTSNEDDNPPYKRTVKTEIGRSAHFFNIDQSLHLSKLKVQILSQFMFLSTQLFPTLLQIYCKQAYGHDQRD